MGVRWKQGLFSVWAVLSLVWIVVALVGIYRSTSALIFTPADREYICAAQDHSGARDGKSENSKELGKLSLYFLSEQLGCERDKIVASQRIEPDVGPNNRWRFLSPDNLYSLFLFLVFPTLILPTAVLATLAISECLRNSFRPADE